MTPIQRLAKELVENTIPDALFSYFWQEFAEVLETAITAAEVNIIDNAAKIAEDLKK